VTVNRTTTERAGAATCTWRAFRFDERRSGAEHNHAPPRINEMLPETA
jgi:hypothetical protein